MIDIMNIQDRLDDKTGKPVLDINLTLNIGEYQEASEKQGKYIAFAALLAEVLDKLEQ